MKPVLMIHEVAEWMFGLPLHEYTLTFDDGLYTQYVHFDKIKNIDTDKIFFINTGIVASEQTYQSDRFIQCHVAHSKLLENGDLSHYMNWSQIHEINNTDRCEIGGHSHLHRRPDIRNIINDTKLMTQEFNVNNIKVSAFCFPYNDEHEVYRRLLQRNGFNRFYGKARIDIYDI